MNNKQNLKHTIYFARRWLEDVLTACRGIKGFLYNMRTSGHMSWRYTSMECQPDDLTVEQLLRILVNMAMIMDEADFQKLWQRLGTSIYHFADEYGDEFNRHYARKKV